MRTFYSMLLCMLVFAASFSQEKEEVAQDTIEQKTVVLDEVLITGNILKDPVFIQVSNDYQKNTKYKTKPLVPKRAQMYHRPKPKTIFQEMICYRRLRIV